MQKIIILSISILFISCMPEFRTINYLPPRYEKIESLNVGKIQEKAVGETMLFVIDAKYIPGFEAISDYQISSPTGAALFAYQNPFIQKGEQCSVVGTIENGDYLCAITSKAISSGVPVDWSHCILINSLGEPYADTSCIAKNPQIWVQKPNNFLKPIKVFLPGSFRQEIVYNGKSKDMIKLQYREYKDDFARAAFYQELIYDLSESNEIGFKGMKIEVIEATNSVIKFIVKSGSF